MSKSNIDIIKLPKTENMEYSVDYETPKSKRKFIERCKRTIRKSKEYKDYIRFLKDNLDMDRCAFFNQVHKNKGMRVSIEIHHEPFVLEDIVQIIIEKHLHEGITLNELEIADDVMKLHYENKVGLIPLSKTLHELYHNTTGENRLFIPIYMCYGNYAEFIKEYWDYMDDQLKLKIEKKIEESKNVKPEDYEKLLEAKFQYIEMDGVDLPKKMEIEEEMIA